MPARPGGKAIRGGGASLVPRVGPRLTHTDIIELSPLGSAQSTRDPVIERAGTYSRASRPMARFR